jgi:hypothetical protein
MGVDVGTDSSLSKPDFDGILWDRRIAKIAEIAKDCQNCKTNLL